jgi:hypothetical protein
MHQPHTKIWLATGLHASRKSTLRDNIVQPWPPATQVPQFSQFHSPMPTQFSHVVPSQVPPGHSQRLAYGNYQQPHLQAQYGNAHMQAQSQAQAQVRGRVQGQAQGEIRFE